MAKGKLFTIVKATHFFKLENVSLLALDVIKRFAFGNTEFTFEKCPESGRFIRLPQRIYAGRKLDNTEFRFNIEQYDTFIDYLDQKRVERFQYDIKDKPLYKPTKASMTMPAGWTPRPKQIPILDYLGKPGRMKVVTLQTGGGKMERLSNPIRIPGGRWKRMGDIQVGDKVIAADGTPTTVTAIHPHGKQQLWKVTFWDGRHVEVGIDHLWKVYYANRSGHTWGVVDTKELMQLVDKSDTLVYIPLIEPDAGNVDATFDIPPYKLGVKVGWQGDSTTVIPDVYLDASIKDRKALLCGLMDIAGYFDNTNTPIYDTTSKQLAIQIKYLVRSLGGIAKIAIKELTYQITIEMKEPAELFSISHKKERANDENQYAADLKLRVKRIEKGHFEEAQCITVDHPDHLYVTKDFIVTHNTATALKAIATRQERLAITVLGRYFDKWQGDLIENYGEEYADDNVIAIRGYKALQGFLQELYEEGEILFDIILITTTTWNDYVKAYESLGTLTPPKWWVSPEDFWRRLGIGMKLVDEVHQHFHANFVGDLYTHGPDSIALSATLECVEQFERKMYEVAYPPRFRMDGGAYIKYCHVSALHYRINNIKKIRHKQRGAYSHNLYERSLKKRKSQYENYFEMIARIIKREYLDVRKNTEQKMIVFVANVFMCEELRDYLIEVLNDPLLRINKYTSEDPLEVITEESNICITTLGSAGTAIDIKNLIFCLMTTAVSQPRANLQAMGRLRDEFDKTKVEPHFMYLVCDDIPKHIAYHKEKLKLFDGRALSHKEVFYPDAI